MYNSYFIYLLFICYLFVIIFIVYMLDYSFVLANNNVLSVTHHMNERASVVV